MGPSWVAVYGDYFEGSPSGSDAGIYTIMLKVDDGSDASTIEFDLTVINFNEAPNVSDLYVTCEEDASISFTLFASDNDGDDLNDNPWKMLYPWQEGDYIIIEPYGWYQDGDSWIANLAEIGKLDENSADDLNEIKVVPNPYIVNSNYFNESPGNHLIRFTRLPTKCTISIYTISGEFVKSVEHDDPFSGNEWWDITNGRGQVLAPGLYIYVVEAPGAEPKIDKFAIVR